ncbi:MAG: ECF-type sigma factor [Gammaproteobacteria bacterium]
MLVTDEKKRSESGIVSGDGQITQLLREASDGDAQASHALYQSVYVELRKIARAQRRRMRRQDTLNTTALINEAYLRLAGSDLGGYRDRTHFYATASKAMRQILVSYARRVTAAKRGGDQNPVTLTDIASVGDRTLDEVLAIDQVLGALESDNPRYCRVFECRVFGGMTIDETAQALDVSAATIKRDWSVISAWVYREVGAQ